MIDVVFTDGKEKYLKKLAEKEAVNKRKSDIYTIIAVISLVLGVVFIFLGAGGKPTNIWNFISLFCACLMVVFAKLESRPRALYYDAQDRKVRASAFLEKLEKKQIFNVGYSCLSNEEYLVYDYEDDGKIKNGSLYIDKYECRKDIDKSILIFGDEIIFKRKYSIGND